MFGTSKEISKIMLILVIVLTIIVFMVLLITIGLVSGGMKLYLLGFTLIFIGVILMMVSAFYHSYSQ